MWRLVVLILSLILYCNAQNAGDLMSALKAMGCDELDLSQEEQTCYMDFISHIMKAYGSLATTAGNYMSDSENNSSQEDMAMYMNAIMGVFGTVCKSDVCLNGIKKTYTACKSSFQNLIKFDMVAIIELLCYKNSNGKFCVNDLPNFQGFAPSACGNILQDQKCNDTCKMELQNISSTCCYRSMLTLFYPDISPKKIWGSCELSIPKVCDLPTSSYPGDDNDNDGDDDNDDNDDNDGDDDDDKTSEGMAFVYVLIILLLSLIVLFLAIFLVRVKCKRRVFNYDDDYTKVPFDIEDSDEI